MPEHSTPLPWHPHLHIYSPEGPHEPANIVGDRTGLTHLRDLLTALLDQPQAPFKLHLDAYHADGEQFTLTVSLTGIEGIHVYRLPYEAKDLP